MTVTATRLWLWLADRCQEQAIQVTRSWLPRICSPFFTFFDTSLTPCTIDPLAPRASSASGGVAAISSGV